MRKALLITILSVGLAGSALGAGKGPEISIIDDKVSIHAEAVPLSRLLRLLDRATGLTSKVPPELANRNVSVRFSNLSLDDAIRKIFEGQPVDYVLVQGQGIFVTGTSQNVVAGNSAAPNSPPPQETFVEDNPFAPQPPFGGAPQPVPGFAPQVNPNNPNVNQNPNQQPATIQTLFGPIPNPRANQPIQQPGMPMVTPGQPANNGINTPGSIPGLPASAPFGANPVFQQQNTPPANTIPGYQPPFPSAPPRPPTP